MQGPIFILRHQGSAIHRFRKYKPGLPILTPNHMNHAAIPARPALHPVRLFRQRQATAFISWLTLLSFLHLITGCNNYYRTQGKDVNPDNVTRLAESKVFFLHQGSLVWRLQNPRLNGEVLEGLKEEIPDTLARYKTPVSGTSPRYKLRDKSLVMNLVHVYINEYQLGTGKQVGIPLSAIQRIDLVEKDKNKTTLSHVVGGVGIAVGALAVLGIIVLLTKSSCPFVYAHDGNQYQFVGETYGGAIFAPLERNDYMPLPDIQPRRNRYQLKITNELKERQYTNLAELWVVQHDVQTKVLLDKYGQIQTLTNLQAPAKAFSSGGADCSRQLMASDKNAFLFNEQVSGTAFNSVVLTFDKPEEAGTGKLVLRAQNSLWLDYLYGEFASKFGVYYTKWVANQKKLPAHSINQWLLDQGIPLKVYVETGQGWQLVDYIPSIGPLAARDLVVPVDLSKVLSRQIRVKLEAGFMFWELDYAAMDFSLNQPVKLEKCRPQSALDEKGVEQKRTLSDDDALYLTQLRPGTEVTLMYQTELPEADSHSHRTAFLRTKGYYEHIRSYEGLPNLPELYAFRKPGRFTEFSKEKYLETTREISLATTNP